jgi:hypothetical protein
MDKSTLIKYAIFIFFCFVLIAPLARAQSINKSQSRDSARAILARSKSASGGSAWNKVHSLRIKGKVKLDVANLSGTFTKLENLHTGRWMIQYDYGAVTTAQGFDGTTGWSKSTKGKITRRSSPASQKKIKTNVYQNARGWWFPKRWPAKIRLVSRQTDGGKHFWVLKISPARGNSFHLWINAKTYLVSRLVSHTNGRQITTFLSNYQTVHGIKLPFNKHVVIGQKKDISSLKGDSVAVNVPVGVDNFAIPGSEKNEASFANGGNSATIPFHELPDGHIVVPVTVNGQPAEFWLDTGGINSMLPEAAKRLGITGKGSMSSSGAGGKQVHAKVGKAAKLKLGGKITLHNQTFHIHSFLPGKSKHHHNTKKRKFAGTIGYRVIKQFVVRIDYAHRKLTFIRPQAFDSTNAGTAVPFRFIGTTPFVKGSIDGISGLFKIDTGAPGLILTTPFATKHHLYARYKSTPAYTVGLGIGGGYKARIARAGKLMLGSVTVHKPVVKLSTMNRGAFASKAYAGNVGGKILRQFTVTLDYAHHKIYLKPNKNYDTPMKYDRSGMLLIPKAGSITIAGVMSDGPADQAGLKTGDVITAVNGKPVSSSDFYELRKKMSNEAPGTKLKLTIGKGKKAHTVIITLRRLIPATGGLEK